MTPRDDINNPKRTEPSEKGHTRVTLSDKDVHKLAARITGMNLGEDKDGCSKIFILLLGLACSIALAIRGL